MFQWCYWKKVGDRNSLIAFIIFPTDHAFILLQIFGKFDKNKVFQIFFMSFRDKFTVDFILCFFICLKSKLLNWLKTKVGKHFDAFAVIGIFCLKLAERYSVPRLAHCYVCHDASTPNDGLVHCLLKEASSLDQAEYTQLFPNNHHEKRLQWTQLLSTE